MTKLMLVTDAWHPQINGVVRSWTRSLEHLSALGVTVEVLSPAEYRTVPCPTYPEIRLSLASPAGIRRRIGQSGADFYHLATEGPLGQLAKLTLQDRGDRFTTSYHTRFPEYLAARLPIPQSLTYAFMRRFHNAGCGCMVATRSLEAELRQRGFERLMRWSRGVDHLQFRPVPPAMPDLPRPVFVYVGRVAVEKNLQAFLDLDLPGSKLVVGGGPHLDDLARRYPAARFTGAKLGEDLVAHYCAGDVFVFPSLTDTFGNVILEALACGLPVAAYPVTGPMDILTGSDVGALDADLRAACLRALDLDRSRCREFALQFTWDRCTRQLFDNIVTANENAARLAA